MFTLDVLWQGGAEGYLVWPSGSPVDLFSVDVVESVGDVYCVTAVVCRCLSTSQVPDH